MKWQLLSLVIVAVAVWGCDALTDEPTAGVQSLSGNADPDMTYTIGLDMKKDKQVKKVKLAIHRDSSGNPMCVVVKGFTGVQFVPLQLGGAGMWKLNASDKDAQGTYARYRPKNNKQQFGDLVLHWTTARGDLTANNLTNAEGRLEYFMVEWNKIKYEYQSDIDGKSNLVSGSKTDPPPTFSDVSDVSCNS